MIALLFRPLSSSATALPCRLSAAAGSSTASAVATIARRRRGVRRVSRPAVGRQCGDCGWQQPVDPHQVTAVFLHDGQFRGERAVPAHLRATSCTGGVPASLSGGRATTTPAASTRSGGSVYASTSGRALEARRAGGNFRGTCLTSNATVTTAPGDSRCGTNLGVTLKSKRLQARQAGGFTETAVCLFGTVAGGGGDTRHRNHVVIALTSRNSTLPANFGGVSDVCDIVDQ